MNAKPILFSTPMVHACMREIDPKTQTRRVIKFKNHVDGETLPDRVVLGNDGIYRFYLPGAEAPMWRMKARYQPGDILWVRETFFQSYEIRRNSDLEPEKWCYEEYWYVVTESDPRDEIIPKLGTHWETRPAIYMPRAAARLFLRVTDVRAERLQDISDADAHAEGMESPSYPIIQFKDLWNSINEKRDDGAYVWDANPWVWVYTFERIEKPADWKI